MVNRAHSVVTVKSTLTVLINPALCNWQDCISVQLSAILRLDAVSEICCKTKLKSCQRS